MRRPIDAKLMLYASVAAFLVYSAWMYLLSHIVIWPLVDSSLPSEGVLENIWVLRLWKYLGLAAFSLGFVLIFVRGYEGKPGVGEGIRYALLVGILVVIPAFFFNLGLLPPRPTSGIVARLVIEYVGVVIMGVIANLIYRSREVKVGV